MQEKGKNCCISSFPLSARVLCLKLCSTATSTTKKGHSLKIVEFGDSIIVPSF